MRREAWARCVCSLVLGSVGVSTCGSSNAGGHGGDSGTGGAAGAGGTTGGGGAKTSEGCTWEMIESHWDEQCNGTKTVCKAWTYDERGFQDEAYSDPRCDGSRKTNCEVPALDADGKVLSTRIERGCDGVATGCVEFTYAADGEVTEATDDECDGQGLKCRRYEYDAAGNELRWESDRDCDGPESCRSATYDTQGRSLEQNYDNDCDGAPDTCTHYEYSPDLLKATVGSDDGCDGTPEQCWEHHFDKEGHLLEEFQLDHCGGSTMMGTCAKHLWDAHGNPTGIEVDNDCDGVPNECRYQTYACVPEK